MEDKLLRRLKLQNELNIPYSCSLFDMDSEFFWVQSSFPRLKRYFRSLESGLFTLLNKKMPFEFFRFDKLRGVLVEIAKKLPNGWQIASASSDDQSYLDEFFIRRHATVFSAMDQGRLKLFISLPVAIPSNGESSPSEFTLFKILRLPVTIGQDCHRLVDLPDYLAISSRDGRSVDKYVELAYSQIKDCDISDKFPVSYCPINVTAIKRMPNSRVASCALSIFINDSDSEKKWCRRESLKLDSNESEEVIPLGKRRWAVSVTKPQSIKFDCLDLNKKMSGSHILPLLSIFRIPNGCTGVMDKWEIPATLTSFWSLDTEAANESITFIPLSNLTSGFH